MVQKLANLVFFVIALIGYILSLSGGIPFFPLLFVEAFVVFVAFALLYPKAKPLEAFQNAWYMRSLVQVPAFLGGCLFLLMTIDTLYVFTGVSYAACVFFILMSLMASERPLSRIEGFPAWIETSIFTLGWIFFIFHLTTVLILPAMELGEAEREPCGRKSPQGLCYTIPFPTCRAVWLAAEESCKEELRPILETKGPASLVGGMITKCQTKKYDKQMYWNRTNSDDSQCIEYFNTLAK